MRIRAVVILAISAAIFGCDGNTGSLTGSMGGASVREFLEQESSRDDGKIANDGEKHISEFRILSEAIGSVASETTNKDKWYLGGSER